jgi:outer membrane immunogenic protein
MRELLSDFICCQGRREDQMRNKLLGLATGTLVVLGTGSAFADGMPRSGYAAPVCAPANFAGFYLGGDVGYAIANTNATFFDASGDTIQSNDHRGATYGVLGGYNFQRCNLVVGIEADWSWVDGDASNHIGEDVVKARLTDFGSVRGRAGVVASDALFYATAGWAWANGKFTFSDPVFGGRHFNIEENGIVFGGGVEFALRSSILLRAEYLHYVFDRDSFRQQIFMGPGNASLRQGDVDELRLALSFKFGGDRVAPVPLK